MDEMDEDEIQPAGERGLRPAFAPGHMRSFSRASGAIAALGRSFPGSSPSRTQPIHTVSHRDTDVEGNADTDVWKLNKD